MKDQLLPFNGVFKIYPHAAQSVSPIYEEKQNRNKEIKFEKIPVKISNLLPICYVRSIHEPNIARVSLLCVRSYI